MWLFITFSLKTAKGWVSPVLLKPKTDKGLPQIGINFNCVESFTRFSLLQLQRSVHRFARFAVAAIIQARNIVHKENKW